MRTVLLLAVIFIFGLSNLRSQEDAQLNLLTSSPLAINPATIGYFQTVKWRAWMNHRDQWSNLLKRGMITETFSFDMALPKKNIALGVLISNNSSLKGSMNDLSIMGCIGYNLTLSKHSHNYLTFGLQAGVKQKSFDPGKLSFNDQYIDGIGYSPDNPTSETFPKSSTTYPDFNTGLLWYVKDRWKHNKPWLGISAYHLTNPNESFTSYQSRLPRKYIAYGGLEFISSRNTSMMPQFMIANQGSFTQASIGYLFSFNNFRSKNYTSFELGAFYRTSDAVALTGGFEFMNFKFLFSYEYTISTLNKSKPGTGCIDFTIRYVREGSDNRTIKFY